MVQFYNYSIIDWTNAAIPEPPKPRNECLDGTHFCVDIASCVDNQESYLCLCKSGFTGSGIECTDIDECIEGMHNCSENAQCSNSIGSFSCFCNLDSLALDSNVLTLMNVKRRCTVVLKTHYVLTLLVHFPAFVNMDSLVLDSNVLTLMNVKKELIIVPKTLNVSTQLAPFPAMTNVDSPTMVRYVVPILCVPLVPIC